MQCGPCGETSSHPNVSIRTNQQLTRLRKITVISGITLRAHFSLGIVKFDTLSNLLLTLANMIKNKFKDAKIDGEYTNHSLRASGASEMFVSHVPEK